MMSSIKTRPQFVQSKTTPTTQHLFHDLITTLIVAAVLLIGKVRSSGLVSDHTIAGIPLPIHLVFDLLGEQLLQAGHGRGTSDR
jgi:hypothetical protein